MSKPAVQAIDVFVLGIGVMAVACAVYLVRTGYSDKRQAANSTTTGAPKTAIGETPDGETIEASKGS